MFFLLFSSVNEELYANGHFETMSIDTDEDEHSIEMQLPFIAKVMERWDMAISFPVMNRRVIVLALSVCLEPYACHLLTHV